MYSTKSSNIQITLTVESSHDATQLSSIEKTVNKILHVELVVISTVTSCQEQFLATTGAEANDKSTGYTDFFSYLAP